MTSVNEITPVLETNNQKNQKVIQLLEESVLNILKNGGINHSNILNVFSTICKKLEFDSVIKKEIINDTGSEKALMAIKIIKYCLQKYLQVYSDKISDKEKKVINFFLSEEGELILMATTSIIVKAFNHVSEAYDYADLNDDGCVCGQVECSRFWKKIFCCSTKKIK